MVGFEGLYEVSNTGNVRSLDRYVNGKNGSRHFIKGVMMKLQVNKKGYYGVILHKDGRHYSKIVHRLVAEAFIPNPYNLPQVNHIDTNKKNNSVKNLEWITNEDNMRHAVEHGCFDNTTQKQIEHALENQRMIAERRKKAVVQLLDGECINIFESIAEANEHMGLDSRQGHISSCCRGKRNSCCGYQWMYLEDYIKENKNE